MSQQANLQHFVLFCLLTFSISCSNKKDPIKNVSTQCPSTTIENYDENPFVLNGHREKIVSRSEKVEHSALFNIRCVSPETLKILGIDGRHMIDRLHRFSDIQDARIKLNDLSASDKKTLEEDSCFMGAHDQIEMQTYADPFESNQKHLNYVGQPQVDQALAAAGLKYKPIVAVIDTGADISHDDLSAVLWENSLEINGVLGVDDDQNGYIDDKHGFNFKDQIGNPSPVGGDTTLGHGTHVAGLVLAEHSNNIGGRGLSAGARLMALNVFGGKPTTNSTLTNEAIRYAVDNGADVINLSLGGIEYSASTESAIAYAINNGVVLITAAGNDSRYITNDKSDKAAYFTPASMGSSFAGLVTVGAEDTTHIRRSHYSNYSTDHVEIAAPGSENSFFSIGLISTFPGNSYVRFEGTSMAAPLVSGAASTLISILKSRNQVYLPANIENLITRFAKTQYELGAYFKHGRALDYKASVEYLLNNTEINTLPDNVLDNPPPPVQGPQESPPSC